jgi:LmbE family N-acetylglucosaminyl deacetylase
MARILIVAAHPDDEVLGCGGTIARHAAAGHVVNILFMADGVGARGRGVKAGAKTERRAAALQSAKILGARKPQFLNFADNRMDEKPLLEIVHGLERAVAKLKPDVVYTHHRSDLNIDHRITHDAVLTTFRPLPGASVKAIYSFEVPSSTEWAAPSAGDAFVPALFVDTAPFQAIKTKALNCYIKEMRPFPHPRSLQAIEALGRWRGASVGLKAAEAFMVVRLLHV